jgi:hypothetical protein
MERRHRHVLASAQRSGLPQAWDLPDPLLAALHWGGRGSLGGGRYTRAVEQQWWCRFLQCLDGFHFSVSKRVVQPPRYAIGSLAGQRFKRATGANHNGTPASQHPLHLMSTVPCSCTPAVCGALITRAAARADPPEAAFASKNCRCCSSRSSSVSPRFGRVIDLGSSPKSIVELQIWIVKTG